MYHCGQLVVSENSAASSRACTVAVLSYSFIISKSLKSHLKHHSAQKVPDIVIPVLPVNEQSKQICSYILGMFKRDVHSVQRNIFFLFVLENSVP